MTIYQSRCTRLSEERYTNPNYRKCGKRGISLPALSVGLWHNFGDAADLHNARLMLRKAFDLGITHFDLANAQLKKLLMPLLRSSIRGKYCI